MCVFTVHMCTFLLGILLGVEFLAHRVCIYPTLVVLAMSILIQSNLSMSFIMTSNFLCLV